MPLTLDPVTGVLRIVTHSGFDPGFLEHFAVVDYAHIVGWGIT